MHSTVLDYELLELDRRHRAEILRSHLARRTSAPTRTTVRTWRDRLWRGRP